jgi:hypothetical protein
VHRGVRRCRGQTPMLRNVTVSTADLAVELVGNGVNRTFAVPEHGTVMPVGIFFGTKKLVKPS